MSGIELTSSWRGPQSAATPLPTMSSYSATCALRWPSPGNIGAGWRMPRMSSRKRFTGWCAPWPITTIGIVRNVARTAISKDGRRAALAPLTLLENEPPAPTPVDPVVAGDVERAIEALAPMQQACVRLCDIEGFTSVEAARMLGIGEGTVRTHLYRARKQLDDGPLCPHGPSTRCRRPDRRRGGPPRGREGGGFPAKWNQKWNHGENEGSGRAMSDRPNRFLFNKYRGRDSNPHALAGTGF